MVNISQNIYTGFSEIYIYIANYIHIKVSKLIRIFMADNNFTSTSISSYTKTTIFHFFTNTLIEYENIENPL